jgi:hypothetical protein
VRKLKTAAAVAVLGVGLTTAVAVASAAGTIPPKHFTANVKPGTDTKPPFKFTVFGHLVPPKLECSSTSSTNCVPCPHGSKSYYCVPPDSKVCAGSVEIKVTLGANSNLADSRRTIETVHTPVKNDCTYDETIVIRTSELTSEIPLFRKTKHKTETIFFDARFLGNTVLAPKSADTVTAKAKLVSPF